MNQGAAHKKQGPCNGFSLERVKPWLVDPDGNSQKDEPVGRQGGVGIHALDHIG